MNSITRLVYGLVSTILLAAGFLRAADHFDPMNNSLQLANKQNSTGVAAPCIGPCANASQTA